ncbi:YicC family protein [Dysgonomonas sp. Marseille-P4677]|uniref:YicC/YloC family endoribonuclease n=1 Tax=Dysgonomonas sp. Marseille-P4677 TaxID=2364790 RepID=UPI0019137DC5|nr:YicC/YloC family endoribonuclease [Dysgonomonas sp. Marseille-P4677]MBK5721115.1 YicC family protein [Dysgonomonas sp. Marseille-P4677]
MIQSMTGFGKASTELDKRKVTVEIKSLNSKQLDLSVRMPNLYKENEMWVRNLLSRKLERGKVDFLIYVENIGNETPNQINQNLLEGYYKQIKESAERLGIETPTDWFQTLLRLPDVLKYESQEVDAEEWNAVSRVIDDAVKQLLDFRKQEGAMLQKLFEEKISNIASLLNEIEPYEAERVDKIKVRITEALQKIEDFDYDKNRFEQEMIYYIEKLDINEEKSRLTNHLNYFLETMKSGSGQGKKLGFISQEMGREINTMGSKSNHAEMQQIVVRMKDELEQIKEQVLNVL